LISKKSENRASYFLLRDTLRSMLCHDEALAKSGYWMINRI